MAERTSAGYLTSSTGVKSKATALSTRFIVELPAIPSITMLFIDVVSGVASIDIELRDGRSTGYIPVRTITSDAVVKLALPASVVACNITANTGTVTITYRSVVVDSIPNLAIEVFTGGAIEAATSTIVSAGVSGSKRFYGPTAPNVTTAATLFTIAAGKKAIIEYIWAGNVTASAATLTLSIGVSATGTKILTAYSIPANGLFWMPCEFTMVAAEVMQGFQGTSAAINLIINGSETSI